MGTGTLWAAIVSLLMFCREAADLGECPREAEHAEGEEMRASDEVKHQRSAGQRYPSRRRFLVIEHGEHPEENDDQHQTHQTKHRAMRWGGYEIQDAESKYNSHSSGSEDTVHENIIHALDIEPKTPVSGKVLVRFSTGF